MPHRSGLELSDVFNRHTAWPWALALALALALWALRAPAPGMPPVAGPASEQIEQAVDAAVEAGATAGVSRAAPLPLDAVVRLGGWDVRIVEHARGDAAWELLQSSPGNPAPAPAGWEYVLIKARATHTGAEPQWAFDTGQIHVVGDRAVAYRGFAAVPPSPSLGESRRMQPGETTEGWTAHLVRRDERDLLICVGNLITEARYVALTPGAALAPDRELARAEPTALGADHREPAGVGETVVAEEYAVTLLELHRGDAAWERIYAGNRYNDPPAEGFEFVLARVRMRLLGRGDEPGLLTAGSFMGASGAERVDQPSIVEPDPGLHEIVFPGGEAEGWVAVQVRAGDPQARLVISESYSLSDNRNARYFALE